jgi:hypothetical protein
MVAVLIGAAMPPCVLAQPGGKVALDTVQFAPDPVAVGDGVAPWRSAPVDRSMTVAFVVVRF